MKHRGNKKEANKETHVAFIFFLCNFLNLIFQACEHQKSHSRPLQKQKSQIFQISIDRYHLGWGWGAAKLKNALKRRFRSGLKLLFFVLPLTFSKEHVVSGFVAVPRGYVLTSVASLVYRD